MTRRLNDRVLEILATADVAFPEIAAVEIADRLGVGVHKVVHALVTLERAELAMRFARPKRTTWMATERGREVNAELVRVTAARGGSFVPLVRTSLTDVERYAITKGGWV